MKTFIHPKGAAWDFPLLTSAPQSCHPYAQDNLEQVLVKNGSDRVLVFLPVLSVFIPRGRLGGNARRWTDVRMGRPGGGQRRRSHQIDRKMLAFSATGPKVCGDVAVEEVGRRSDGHAHQKRDPEAPGPEEGVGKEVVKEGKRGRRQKRGRASPQRRPYPRRILAGRMEGERDGRAMNQRKSLREGAEGAGRHGVRRKPWCRRVARPLKSLAGDEAG